MFDFGRLVGWLHTLIELTWPRYPRYDLWLHCFDCCPLTVDLMCWLWLLRWFLTRHQNFQKGLSCRSIFHIDFDFRLCFFIWSSKIVLLANLSLWFLQGIFSCLSNLKLSSSLHFDCYPLTCILTIDLMCWLWLLHWLLTRHQNFYKGLSS